MMLIRCGTGNSPQGFGFGLTYRKLTRVRKLPITKRWQPWVLLIVMLSGCAADLTSKQPANIILEDVHFAGTVVAFNTDSTILASGGSEGYIQLSNVPDGRTLVRMLAHRDTVNGIAFLDATHLISAGYDGRLAAWDTSGKLLR